MRYYATRTPEIPVHCNGQVLSWPGRQIGEGMVMVNEAANPKLAACIDRKIAAGAGGDIRQVTEAEYAEWQKKIAANPLFVPRDRESISGSGGANPTSQVRGTSGVQASPPGPSSSGAAASRPAARAVADDDPPAPAAPAAAVSAPTPPRPAPRAAIPTRKIGS